MSERVDDVIQEFIEFVNRQIGAYVDALSGFAGHHSQVSLQVYREQRPVSTGVDASGLPTIVYASYEDPSKPSVIHNRVVRASDYLAENAPGGSNEEQHARAILVFVFTYWELETRPRLAAARGVELKDVTADSLGDLRELRHAILHAKGILRGEKWRKLKPLQSLFAADVPISLPCESMQAIFEAVKRDCAQLLFSWLGVSDAPLDVSRIRDMAIQRKSRAPDA